MSPDGKDMASAVTALLVLHHASKLNHMSLRLCLRAIGAGQDGVSESSNCCVSLEGRLCVQGTMSARFLRHEGFLGAVGAFLKVHPMTPPNQSASVGREPRKVRSGTPALVSCRSTPWSPLLPDTAV